MIFIFRLLAFLLLPMALFAISEEPHHTTAYIGYPNELDILPSYSTYSTDHFWNRQGKRRPTYNHFHRQSWLLYAEYALNNCNSFSLNGGYSQVEESLNGHSRGFEDAELGWKHLLYEGKTSALTSQLIGIIPCGDKKSSIRYGQWGFQANLLYSDIFSLFNRFGWYDLGLGYRFYNGFPSDQIRADASVGFDLTSRLFLIGSSHLEYGLFNGSSQHNFNHVVFHPNYRLLKVNLECVVKICSHCYGSIGAFKHVWGRNVGAGGGFFGGTWILF
jgi:hypothetical protein